MSFSQTAGREGMTREQSEVERIIQEVQDELIGMKNIKDELRRQASFAEVIRLRRHHELPVEKITLHMVFKGAPGTGKTMLARKLAKLYKAIGLIRENKLVEVDRSNLIGSALGDTEKLVVSAFEQAKNGILFIDEAYAVAGISAEDVTKDLPDAYSKAAINTMLKLMEDYRSSIVVIVAGYEAPMDRFLKTNVGFKSRFSKTFVFPNYNKEQLLQIFEKFASEAKYTLDDGAISRVRQHIATWDIDAKDFGNAREVRNFFEAILPMQALRIAGTEGFRSFPKDDFTKITADDVIEATEAHNARL